MDERQGNLRGSGPVEGGRGNQEVPPATPVAPVEPAEPAEVVDELAEVTRQRDEYLDALQRLKAEFDNFRKRQARDQQNLFARANERLVKELLPVVDDLERTLEAAAASSRSGVGQADASAPDRLRQASAGGGTIEDGVRLVVRALSDALAKEGLVEVDTKGAFDPHTQEALLTQPSEAPEGTVIQVLQKGYRLGDVVLRPARVVVSSGANG